MKIVTKSNVTHIQAVFNCPLTNFSVELYFERSVNFKNMKQVISYFMAQVSEAAQESENSPFESVMLKSFHEELYVIYNELCLNGKLMRKYKSHNTEIHIKPVKIKGFIK